MKLDAGVRYSFRSSGDPPTGVDSADVAVSAAWECAEIRGHTLIPSERMSDKASWGTIAVVGIGRRQLGFPGQQPSIIQNIRLWSDTRIREIARGPAERADVNEVVMWVLGCKLALE